MTAVKSDNLEYLCDLPRLKKNWTGSINFGGASGLNEVPYFQLKELVFFYLISERFWMNVGFDFGSTYMNN